MKEAGCVDIWFGIESGSKKVLEAIKKGITPEQTMRAFKWAKEVGIKPNPNVILGVPGETRETALETIRFVEKLIPDYLGCYTLATPYPGTPMYDDVREKGWLKVTDFDKYDNATPIFETPMLSTKELMEIYDQIPQRFYFRPIYILRMFSKGGLSGLRATRTAFGYFIIAIRSKLSRNKLPPDRSYSNAHLRIN